MFLASFLTYLGMLLFSFSLEKHYKQVIKKAVNKNTKLFMKILGCIFLIISFIVFIKTIGISLGITYFIGLLTIVAIFIAFMYTYKPYLIIKISVLLFVLTLILNFL
ncbi:hypothetical protein CRV03_06755 [Arcobacter sp. F155]|uniref:DUF3325 domain-containing protein n=1 Tax=Arcobacter sp. F155 TaxID=2044512 RepID=UPI00100AADCA|nr:DUF3325 domain-containing protein [Arcobacter sp. F155]RXJ76959.1 hypothetical protein CRV03_06755 [Arcobacter sp. F155]